MSPAGSPSATLRDSLALHGGELIRSRVSMNRATETAARLTRTKERIYVLCQIGGWGTFTLAYIGLGSLARTISPQDACIVSASNAVGLLLSHIYRTHIHRAGWKEIGWIALFPRVVVATLLCSILWTAASWPLYAYLYTGPLPKHLTYSTLFIYGVFNGVWIFGLWSAIYFTYQVFEKLNRLRVEQFQLAASVKEAELRALKSQVNPHFLFNSLNSLRALIDEDAPRARESVTRLANMLRYSLQSGQLETVPFEEEKRIVEDYLALEQIRHENRLRVRWELASEAHACNVPPMLLQTLVENAVKYGISTRRGGGEIGIYARVDGGQLVLRVTNPGTLAAPVSNSAAKAGSSTGVGLRNASERLKLLYGDRAQLHLRADSPDTVTAEVIIPITAS